jgi:hypothetical protein
MADVSVLSTNLWPFAPNWRDSYRTTYEFKTDIFTSRSGKEQRRAQRTTPRRGIQFTVTRAQSELRSLDRFLFKMQDRDIVMPDKTRSVRTTAILATGAAVVTCDAVPDWLAVGASVALVAPDATAAKFTVAAVTDDHVTLSSASAANWPVGTRVYPTLTGTLESEIKDSRYSDEVAEIDIEFRENPGTGTPDTVGSPSEVHNGREILPFEPNWKSALGGSFMHTTDVVDFGRGRIRTFRPIDFGTRLQQVQVQFGTPDERRDIVQFFLRMKGQRGEFYAPSNSNDLVLAEPVTSGGTSLKFAGTEVYDAFHDDTVNRSIMFRCRNGYDYPRLVTAVTTNVDGDSLLELAIPLPLDLDDTTVARISWLPVHRLATDVLNVESVTDGVGQTQLSTRTLEALVVDEPVWGDDGTLWFADYFGFGFSKRFIFDPLDEVVNHIYPSTELVLGDVIVDLDFVPLADDDGSSLLEG